MKFDNIQEVDSVEALKSAIDANKHNVIIVSAEWCAPCRPLQPSLAQLIEKHKGKINFVNVDVDNDDDIADTYKIQSIPALLSIDNDLKELNRKVGGDTIGHYDEWLQSIVK